MFLILGGIITAVLVGYIIITLITIATGEDKARGGAYQHYRSRKF